MLKNHKTFSIVLTICNSLFFIHFRCEQPELLESVDHPTNNLSQSTSQQQTQQQQPVNGSSEHKLELEPLAKKGLIDTSTGKQVSLEEAIKSGLLDTSTGEFVDPNTGFRLTLAEAANKDLINPKFADLLASPCGIFEPRTRRQISLLEAIDKGLFDPKTKSFIDPITGDSVSIENAVNLGFILQTKVSQLEEFTTMAPNNSKVVSLVEGLRAGQIDSVSGAFDNKGKNIP